MKFAGIIAEYDPFHNGHAWQLQAARALGAQTVAVALSCGLTQRGAPPLLPEGGAGRRRPGRRGRAGLCPARPLGHVGGRELCPGGGGPAGGGGLRRAGLWRGGPRPRPPDRRGQGAGLPGLPRRPEKPAGRRGPELCRRPAGRCGAGRPRRGPCRPAGQAQQQPCGGILQGHPRAGRAAGTRPPAPSGREPRGRPHRRTLRQRQRPARPLAAGRPRRPGPLCPGRGPAPLPGGPGRRRRHRPPGGQFGRPFPAAGPRGHGWLCGGCAAPPKGWNTGWTAASGRPSLWRASATR